MRDAIVLSNEIMDHIHALRLNIKKVGMVLDMAEDPEDSLFRMNEEQVIEYAVYFARLMFFLTGDWNQRTVECLVVAHSLTTGVDSESNVKIRALLKEHDDFLNDYFNQKGDG